MEKEMQKKKSGKDEMERRERGEGKMRKWVRENL